MNTDGLSFFTGAALCFTLSCGGQTADPPLDGLYKSGPSVVPAATDVAQLECTPEWKRCEEDYHCCYGPCRPLLDNQGMPVFFGACIGCLPPGLPCHDTSDCCGRCSRECDVRDVDCRGVCLLALPGDFCRRDNECLYGHCEDVHCR
jgi:hypothetical protein